MSGGQHPLADGLPESWAVEWGEDRYGSFMSFAVGNVLQRMRWVPEGKFLMGSPNEETGRYGDEGPQHQVHFRQGFWLADTPCTQALWQVVTGENPSKFKSPGRPVERVSWNDCRAFVDRLNIILPGLEVRLPTEAEWEYACRACSPCATWLGEVPILGENNAPRLDTIAWYGGNSGHGFELAKGRDSSGWSEKQYPHIRAGTRPVGRKLPNPFGLYDMLGNVDEWCEDWFGQYDLFSAGVRTPPLSGTDRVVRGGSYSGLARFIRAAGRCSCPPDNQHASIGLRLARGDWPSPVPLDIATMPRTFSFATSIRSR